MTDPLTGDLDPELRRIEADALALAAPGGGVLPSPRPDQPELVPSWQAEVAMRRARHDAAALLAGAAYQRVLVQELGPDPLGIGPDPVSVEWHEVIVGSGRVGLRVYRPGGPGPHPGVLFVHGGAYWMGGGSAGWLLNDGLCRRLCTGVGAVVVSVDHRLAPEHPYPVPVDDVCAAYAWTLEQADRLAMDPGRIAVFGISSGGNLVAAASQRILDRSAPPVAAVVLQFAALDLSVESTRYDWDGPQAEAAEALVELYTAGADPLAPGISPVRRADLTGLPATLVVTAEFDPLTPDALHYAERLAQAGVPVTRHMYPMSHVMARPVTFRQMHDETVAWLTEWLA